MTKMKKMTLALLGAVLLVACSPKAEENVETPASDSTTVVAEPDTTVSAAADTTLADSTTASM